MDGNKKLKLVKPKSELVQQIVGLLDQSLIPVVDNPSPRARSAPHTSSSSRFSEGEPKTTSDNLQVLSSLLIVSCDLYGLINVVAHCGL